MIPLTFQAGPLGEQEERCYLRAVSMLQQQLRVRVGSISAAKGTEAVMTQKGNQKHMY